jgi:hypothetical protein
MSSFRRALFWPLAAALALAGSLVARDACRLNSATMDEPFHALASAEYAISGTYFANLEHPPLTKLLAGFALRAAGARAPRIPEPFSTRTAEQPRPFSLQSPLEPDDLLAAVRRPFLVLFGLLVLVVAAAVRYWVGGAAGLVAAALLAFEPTHLAHAGVLHTDLAASLGFFGTIALTLLALEKRSFGLWALSGAALGLTLASKFSAILLVPVISVMALAHVLLARRRARRDGRTADTRPLYGLLLAGAVSAAVLFSCYAVAMRSMSRANSEAAVRAFLSSRDALPRTVERIVALSRLSPEVGHYAAGLAGIAVQNRTGGGVNFLHGELSPDGFWDYFLVAFGVKSALGFLTLLAAAAIVLAARRGRFDFLLGALLLPAAYLFVSGMATSYNIGIRHMLPAYPLFLAAAVVILFRHLPQPWAVGVAGLAAVLQLVEVARVHPSEMSFFNALAGGPSNGEAWLNDSNLDWGQDLRRLARALRAEGRDGDVTVAYFGGSDPAYYLPRARIFDPDAGVVPPGLYAVSSFLRCCGPEAMAFHGRPRAAAGYERLRRVLAARGEPVGRVGYSIALYRVREDEQSPR